MTIAFVACAAAAGAFAPGVVSAQTVTITTPMLRTPVPGLPDGVVWRHAPSKGRWIIGRETRLPLCAVGDPELATTRLLEKGWACTRELRDCAIDWTTHRAEEAEYVLRPTFAPRATIVWRTYDAVYGVHELWCARNAASSSHDHVRDYHAAGRASPRSAPGSRFIDAEIVHLYGGFVEHDRPAYARASVTVARSAAWTIDHDDDLTIALQVYGDGGWEDVVSRDVTTTWEQTTYVLEGFIEPLQDVRVELRGRYDRKHRHGAAWLIQDVRVFVELCLRNEGNPGVCVE